MYVHCCCQVSASLALYAPAELISRTVACMYSGNSSSTAACKANVFKQFSSRHLSRNLTCSAFCASHVCLVQGGCTNVLARIMLHCLVLIQYLAIAGRTNDVLAHIALCCSMNAMFACCREECPCPPCPQPQTLLNYCNVWLLPGGLPERSGNVSLSAKAAVA